jgi:hypothetical protein
MPQTVELPDDLADALADEASRRGLSLPDYAVGLSAELCTFNDKHYWVVPGLVTVQPYPR